MKAIAAKHGSKADDAGAFYIAEKPMPEAGPMDLLVRVAAIGMNPVDTKARTRFEQDTVLGWDACGVVESVGAEAVGFAAGDRVYYAGELTRPGCNSEYHLVDCRIAAKAPTELCAEDAAAMPLTSITAWEGLFDRLGFAAAANANSGQSILIIGGAGGVGSVATQLACWSGLKVYATASRPETSAWCGKMGADTVLNHQNALEEELKSAGAEMVDAIFCTTQMEAHWAAMASCIKPFGRIVLIDDPAGPVDITAFKRKSVALAWEFMYTRSMFGTPDLAKQGELLAAVAALLDAGTLVSTRQETLTGLTTENIQAMHIRQESGAVIGKQVLTV